MAACVRASDGDDPVPPPAQWLRQSDKESTISTEADGSRKSSESGLSGTDSVQGRAWSQWHVQLLLLTGVPVLSVLAVFAGWSAYLQASYGRVPSLWLWLRMPPAQLMEPEMCNTRLSRPQVDFSRTWRLDSASLKQCEKSNKHHFPWQYDSDRRNWCWIGLKATCHAHLKSHLSWFEFQELAAGHNRTVSPAFWRFDPLQDPEVCDQPINGGPRSYTPLARAEAMAWFRRYVKVYVLNMPGDTQRWRMIYDRLRYLRIEAVRVLGVDMRLPNVMLTAKTAGWVPQAYNFTKAQENAVSKKQSMGSILGTLGCASAHFKAQMKVLEDGSPLAVVLEDDAWPVEDFVQRLWSLVHEELPCDWEVVSLMSRCPYGKCVSPHLSRVQPDVNEPLWRCHQGVNWGMQGVLYRTSVLREVQRKWQERVFDESKPHCMDVDVGLASISDQVAFYAVPAGQDPGFMKETNHPSARWNINVEGRTYSELAVDPNNMG